MMATVPDTAERIYENDLVYRFVSKSDGLTISVGKVYIDRRDPARIPCIQWYLGEKTRQPLDNAWEQGKIFLLNREVYIGSIAIARVVKKGGSVNGTKHTLLGLVEKVGQDGTRRKYIVPEIPVDRLEKLYPFKVGNYVYWKGWIGIVANVHFQVHWTFDRATNIATGTLPIDLVKKFQLKQGIKLDKLPERICNQCSFKSKSWNPLTVKKLHKKPATLSKIAPVELEVCWIDHFNPLGPSTEVTKPGSILRVDNSVKVFHFSKDDWEYFGPNESFKMSWTAEDQDNALPYEQWQSHMLLSSMELQFGEDPPLKRVKGEPIFNVGEGVVVTAVALQTKAVVAFPNGLSVINHTMKACDIPELGLEVMPRPLPSNLPIKFKNMDLVHERKQTAEKYGFVLDPSEEDGRVMVKWIHDLGDTDTAEKTELVKITELVTNDFQSEFNPKIQTKIVTLRDGNVGTIRGIISPNCKAVVRLAGTFDDKEYWPHEISYLKSEVI